MRDDPFVGEVGCDNSVRIGLTPAVYSIDVIVWQSGSGGLARYASVSPRYGRMAPLPGARGRPAHHAVPQT